jgi:hypothetical protein
MTLSGRKPGVRIAEIEATHLGQSPQPVPKGVGMDIHRRRGGRDVTERIQPGPQGLDQVGVVLLVVADQPGDGAGRLVTARADEVA